MPDPARRLALRLHQLLAGVGREVKAAARGGRRVPSFSSHVPAFTEALTPLVAPFAMRGGRQTLGRIRWQMHRRRRKSALAVVAGWFKAAEPDPIAFDFGLFNAKIADAIRSLTFHFVTSTLETSRYEVEEAYGLLREELAEGLSRGETYGRLAKRVGTIFDNPAKAYDIARSEGHRAVEAGGLIAAKESDVVGGKRWMASPGACDKCMKLAGKTVGLDEPFAVLPGGSPYSVVMHPGLHPRCTCTTEYVLKGEYR